MRRPTLSLLIAAVLCTQAATAAEPYFGITRLDPSLARVYPSSPIESHALVQAEVVLDGCDAVARVEFKLGSGFRLVRALGPGPIDCAGFAQRSKVALGTLVAGRHRVELGYYDGETWVPSGFPLEFDVVDAPAPADCERC